jgi:hypothetical protein
MSRGSCLRFSTCLLVLIAAFCLFAFTSVANAQNLLGGLNGTVTDDSGAVVPGVQVAIENPETGFKRATTTRSDGSFEIADLPLGTYKVTLSRAHFQSASYDQILVKANRVTTLNAKLKVGSESTTVEVSATPLLNQTDTTMGYTVGDQILETTPLGTGSFTQLALLSPGVNADLLGGSGTNAGLGNRAIYANGQRDTSNSFSLNAVSSNNLFNGKSSSEVGSNRNVLNTGENFNNVDGSIQTSTSVYDAIGQALPSPPLETIEEMQVNTSMYDASQGANSGAHIEVITKSGTNTFHGQAYEYYQTRGWNAAPYFRNANPTIPPNQKVPPLNRNQFGATLGGPIIKNKLFFFGSYQYTRASDQLNGTSTMSVPTDLTNDRSPAALANVANLDFGTNIDPSQIDPIALQLLQTKLPNGQYLIPSATITDPALASSLGYDALITGPSSVFRATQVNGNIDYNVSSSDNLSGKYYFQNDPTTNPFGSGSQVIGFPQQLHAASQVVSIENTKTYGNTIFWEQKVGFTREKAFSGASQAYTPQEFGINLFGSTRFPGIFVDNPDNNTFNTLYIGPTSNFANAGMIQNMYDVSSNLTWIKGRHNFSFGGDWEHTRLNIENQNNQVASLDFANYPDLLLGALRPGVGHTVLFNGTTNRHYRANQFGLYAQDKIRLTPTVNLTLGLRWDYDGPLTEENGLLTNFYPQTYSYDLASDTINNIGLVVAGNNSTFPTKGVSNSTLLNRQSGFAPRIGVTWNPASRPNMVVRAGFGMFYDRGQFFTEFSPSAGNGYNGPFGVTLAPPFTVPVTTNENSSFANPFGTTPPPPPPNNLSSVQALVPNMAQLEGGANPFLFGGYDPRNKLPYSENWLVDLQFQFTNTFTFTMGYAGNHGVHETLPIPFNQPQIATPQHPVNGQIYSYGYQPTDANGGTLLSEPFNTATGGNTDLRVPYIGYSPNSVFWSAVGVSTYNALHANITQRLDHGLQLNASYTWSHTLDEQSGTSLFYNGNNPLDPKSSYATSDFDRTHVFTFQFSYVFPNPVKESSFAQWFTNGWQLNGLGVFESGQPYNVYDFSGSVGSLYYSANDFITNPIVPLAPGQTPQSAQQAGNPGATPPVPSLRSSAFTIPQLQPGESGVPPCGPTTTGATLCDNVENTFSSGSRNIFRGPFQSRLDLSAVKMTKITERFSVKYEFDAFNALNHPSFDTPNNNVTFNPCFNPNPCYTFPPHGSLGVIQHTIGSPRFLQMSLHVIF